MPTPRAASAVAVALLLAAAACTGRPAAPPETLEVVFPAVSAWEEDGLTLSGNVLEPLVELDGQQRPVPALAERWYTPDERTWVFELRHGVRRHDGREVDAAQVVEAYRALSRRAGPGRTLFRPLVSLEALASDRVEVRTREPYGPLLHQLLLAALTYAGDRSAPVGTGPYRVAERGPQGLTLVAADARATIRRVRFTFVTDGSERARRLLEGQAHLALDVPAAAAEDLRRAPGHRLAVARGLRLVFLGFDCLSPALPGSPERPNPFRDPRVRRAVALAVDRQRIVAEALHGLGLPAPDLLDPEAQAPRGLPLRPDPEAARRLLAEAGYAAGFEVPLEYTLGRVRDAGPVAEAVTRDLARVGVRAVPQPETDLLARLEQGQPRFFLSRVQLEGPNVGGYYDLFLHTRGDGHGAYNGGYSDPEMDALLEAAERQLRPEQRAPLLRALAERVRSEVPLVPLAVPDELWGADRRLAFEPRRDRRLRLLDLSFPPAGTAEPIRR